MSDEFKTIKIQIDALEAEFEQLTDWEREFVDSVSDQFTNTGKLSIKQMTKLEQIYRRIY